MLVKLVSKSEILAVSLLAYYNRQFRCLTDTDRGTLHIGTWTKRKLCRYSLDQICCFDLEHLQPA